MRRWLILSVLGLAGVLGTSSRASAWWVFGGPYYTSAAFPCVNPPGYYTNLYYYGWMYPWYAYYNYSHGPYNGWWLNGGYATYASCGHNQPACPIPGYVGGPQYGGPPFYPHCSSGSHTPNLYPTAGTVSITMPADAKLLFNGTPAEGSGGQRTFQTPPLQPGQDYAYDLTAQVVVDGQVRQVTERVIVRAGEETKVTLAAK
ncbi:MAG TPA: TIGR03000 domain-containing protein [Gemmataceae bacterium]|nr:TIGR03000 domain-containing protein [Gemmataceae bacterium]